MDITVAKNSTGAIQLGVINIDPKNPADVELNFPSAVGKRIEGQILTADRMDSRNPIGGAAEVEPQTFSKARWFKGRCVSACRRNQSSGHTALTADSLRIPVKSSIAAAAVAP